VGTITKKDLAQSVAADMGCSRNQALAMINRLFVGMRDALMEGERIEIRGFGVLTTRDMKPKPRARNPRTGEVISVPTRKRAHFKPGKELKNALKEQKPSETVFKPSP